MIGKMNQLVSFYRKTFTQDEYGGQVESSEEVYRCYAHITARSSSEGEEFDRNQGVNAYLVKILNTKQAQTLTEKDEMRWNGFTFDLKPLFHVGTQPIYLEFEAERGTPS